jgi:segregation and condensation protein B
MEISQIIPHVEALIFAADRPLPMLEIVDLLNNALAFLEDRATLDQVEAAMEAIQEKYGSEFYAFEVRASGGGYQFLTKKDYYQTVAQLNGDKFIKRLSTAALETLAIIAYRQPISKGEIEHIRGVSTDYSIQKLLEKELIVISGRSEELPGKPLLYATSKVFMDYFGLNSTADLPKLKELFDEDAIQPTLINDDTATIGRNDEREAVINGALVISEDGELIEQEEIILEETTEIPTETPEEAASESEEVEPDDTAPLMESALIAEEIGGRADEPAPEEEDEADAPPKEHKVTRGDGEPDDITEKRFEEELEEEELLTGDDEKAEADKEQETDKDIDDQDDDDEAELKFEEEEEEDDEEDDDDDDDEEDDDEEDEEEEDEEEEGDENDEDDKDKDDDKKQDH